MVVTFRKDTKFNEEFELENRGKWADFVFKLKQQRLKGQIPVVTRRYAVSVTIFFAVLFLGISQLIASANMQVILIKQRYDNIDGGFIDIAVTKDISPPVYFYYELRNTFMMHRSLNQAFCKKQLITGDSSQCDSYKNVKYSCENASKTFSLFLGLGKYCVDDQKYYAPVGGAASIMFNDSFKLTLNNEEIAWTEEGVIVDKLREMFFQPDEKNLCDAKEFQKTVKPIGWKQHICEMGGYRNISLIKWLESATNKNFKKLYRILDTRKHNGLKKGLYRLYVDNEYKLSYWLDDNHAMEKYFWILHPSWIGTEQKFLEVLYLVVGIGLLAFSSFLVGFQIFLMDRRKTYEQDDDNQS